MARDQRRLAAIVSTDVVGYSRLMGQDESGTLAALKAHRRELIDPKIVEYGGRIVKTTGDGMLIEFPSVVDAVRCSVDVQRGMQERNAQIAEGRRIELRVGINVGDIIIDDDDIFGDGVNVAARLQTLAEPGGICVSRVVRDQVLDKLNFAFDDLGPREVKNIRRPVEVFRVALDPASGTAVPMTTGGRHKDGPRQHDRARAGKRFASPRWMVAAFLVAAVIVAAWAGRSWFRPDVIEPYSAQDRRMTFAVLPFEASTGDEPAKAIAAAMTEAATALQERRQRWAKVASARSVEQARSRATTDKDIAAALDVHFLIRGRVTGGSSDYTTELFVIDGPTERTIASRSVPIERGKNAPRRLDELDRALGFLTYKGLELEVQRARSKPFESLDVRDLAFRAYVEWQTHPKQEAEEAYTEATKLLNRALALAPDDSLALYLTANVNLCDCVEGWSRNVAEQQAIGAQALERYLQRDPDNVGGLFLKANLFSLRGQFEESLFIAERVLSRDSEYDQAAGIKAYDLLKLGRPDEALATLEGVRLHDDSLYLPLAAAVNYALGRYEEAARLAQKAAAQMNTQELGNPNKGAINLVWAAAEARLERPARARTALANFNTSVPGVTTLAQMRAWMHPMADLAGYEPLFEGLRLAGVQE